MRRRRGAALVLVLGAVAILAVVAVELASRASADSLRAARAERDAGFRRLIDSAGEVARGVLLEREPREFDTARDAWGREVTLTLGEGERAVLRLEDESGKLNFARTWTHPTEAIEIRRRAARVFEYLRRREPGRVRELREAESKVLSRLSYGAPLLTLDGLREGGLDADAVFGDRGLRRYFTCFGDGRINLNTAEPAVLFALHEEFDEALVERIASFRIGKVFEDPRDLMLVDGVVIRTLIDGRFVVTRDLHERVSGMIGVKSSAFGARVRAEARGRAREGWIFLAPDATRLALEEVLP